MSTKLRRSAMRCWELWFGSASHRFFCGREARRKGGGARLGLLRELVLVLGAMVGQCIPQVFLRVG